MALGGRERGQDMGGWAGQDIMEGRGQDIIGGGAWFFLWVD